MREFSIVIPIYNEKENILPLIEEIIFLLKNKYKYEILVIDDASNDNLDIDILKKKSDFIKIFKNDKNQGQSRSILKGINYSEFDTIVTIDGDGQNNPADIEKLANIYFSDKDCHLVGGIRFKRKDYFIKKITLIFISFK